MILPRSSPNVVPRTTGVGTIPRWGTSRSAAPPPGTFCPPLPPFVVDDVSRQRISSAVVAARGRGSSSRAKASRRTASSESGRYSVCSTQMFTYGPSRKGSLLCTCPYRFTVASGTSFIALCVTTSVGLPVMTRVHPRLRWPACVAKLPSLSDLWWRRGDCQPKLPAEPVAGLCPRVCRLYLVPAIVGRRYARLCGSQRFSLLGGKLDRCPSIGRS